MISWFFIFFLYRIPCFWYISPTKHFKMSESRPYIGEEPEERKTFWEKSKEQPFVPLGMYIAQISVVMFHELIFELLPYWQVSSVHWVCWDGVHTTIRTVDQCQHPCTWCICVSRRRAWLSEPWLWESPTPFSKITSQDITLGSLTRNRSHKLLIR